MSSRCRRRAAVGNSWSVKHEQVAPACPFPSQVSDVSPGSQLQVLQALFQMQTYNPLEAAQQPGAADTPSSVPSPATFPYFSPKEASNLMRFAKRTFISHCRLYLYCLKHPQSEVATTLHVFTFLPVAQPECSLPASESAPKTGGAS